MPGEEVRENDTIKIDVSDITFNETAERIIKFTHTNVL